MFVLYSFVRVVDDLVDQVPADSKGFFHFRQLYTQALKGKPAHHEVIDRFVELVQRRGFTLAWVEVFFDAMESDLSKHTYSNLQDVQKYMYGSAEVVGLMMARILHLPQQAYGSARLLGRAMQYINFLRDIAEDTALGRTYIPVSILNKHHLSDLSRHTAESHKTAFVQLIRNEVGRYMRWQSEAEQDFKMIPKRYRIPIQTASDMYLWTARQLIADPFVVFRRKVKPQSIQVVARVLYNFWKIGLS